jgi:hypothetical protein
MLGIKPNNFFKTEETMIKCLILILFMTLQIQAQTVSLSGTVLSVSGSPVVGATCQFKSISNKAITDATGKYNFSGGNVAARQLVGYQFSLVSEGRNLSVKLESANQITIELFSISGLLLAKIANGNFAAGNHVFPMVRASAASQLYLLRMRLGAEVAWHKLTLHNGIGTITNGSAAVAGPGLAKGAAAPDSLFCTSPDFSGGLAMINGRSISAYTGTQNFRMFSLAPAWRTQCAMPITFNFDNSPGVARYKQLIPDWVATEQAVLVEVCQATFKVATQPKKYATYIANIKTDGGVANTGGNTLNFSTDYIGNQPATYAGWLEVTGVQTHEAVHSYQAYYSTTGADGFGEAMPDAVRALNGYFKWPTGTKCSGSFTDAYQTGGKYWYFIEMKHPGFLTSIWQNSAGDISTRVQSITGESLAAMVSECQSKGMP